VIAFRPGRICPNPGPWARRSESTWRAFSPGCHDCPLCCGVSPSGPIVKRQILLGGLAVGAFIVTLAFSSWHVGLWHSAAEPPTSAAPQPDKDSLVPTGPVASSPSDPSSEAMTSTPPSAAAPTAVAINPPATIAPTEASQGEPQYEQTANPGVDSEAIRRDRGVQHSAGSH
jgi:hypothetical protein